MRTRPPHRRAKSRGGARFALSAFICVLVATATSVAPWTAAPAQAMTQVQQATGYPGDQVTIVIRNDNTGPAFSPWNVNAPAGTSIVSASGSAASGSSQFPCSGSGASVVCGPSGAGGWAAGNLVTVVLQIDAAAAAGVTTGASDIPGSESGSYSITVLAPPAPEIIAPSDGSRTLDTQPTITGTKRAGYGSNVLIDGADSCAIAADAGTTWSCTPSTPLAIGIHAITATQTSPGGDVSPSSAAVSVEVLEPAALAVTHAGVTTTPPAVVVERIVSVANGGPGIAEAVSASVDLGGFPATTCTVAGVDTDCAILPGGVALGDLASSATVEIRATGSVPTGTAEGTVFTLTASADSINDAASPISASDTLTVVAPAPPAISRPAVGSSTTDRTPAIGGTALRDAGVTVSDASGAVCETTADASGNWNCSPNRAFGVGDVALTAVQSMGGLTSDPSTTHRFTVAAIPVRPPPPPPTNTEEPPQTSFPPAAPRPLPSPEETAPPTAPEETAPPTAPPTTTEPDRAPLPLSLSFAADEIQPGTVSTLRGTIGPVSGDEPIEISLSGRVNQGMVYRLVRILVDDADTESCVTETRSFSCTVVLQPGERAQIEMRLFADALNAPDRAIQQVSLNTGDGSGDNTRTVTTAIASDDSDTDEWKAAFTLDMSTLEGAFLPLTAMLLLALAASVAERRRP
ncbi:Ig-like domain-containing protein [Microbacterium sp. AGC85]